MVNPDFNIKNEPGKYSADMPKGDERPVGVPQTKKEFKALLRKDPDKEDDEENGKGKQVKENSPEESVKETESKTKVETPKEKNVSIFSLSEDHSKKQVAMSDKGSELVEAPPEEGEAPVSPQKTKPKPETAHPLMKEPAQQEASKTELPNLHTMAGEKKVETELPRGKKGEMRAKTDTPPNLAKEDIEDFPEHKKEDQSQETVQLDQGKQEPKAPHIFYGEKVENKPINPVEGKKSEETTLSSKEPQSIFTPYAYTTETKERPVNTKFAQEQPDLAYVNPMHMNVQASTTAAAPAAEAARPALSPDMVKLMEQMIDKITTMSNEGKTDTTITIKNPPLFDGANLKLTSFESAQGEFNVTFENLKPEAQRILQENLDGLKMALNEKGFTVHIITATTTAEAPIETGEAQPGKGEREGEKEENPSDQQSEEEQRKG